MYALMARIKSECPIDFAFNFCSATVTLAYCPSVEGCQAIVRPIGDPTGTGAMHIGQIVELALPKGDEGDVYVDKFTIMPYNEFSESLLTPEAQKAGGNSKCTTVEVLLGTP